MATEKWIDLEIAANLGKAAKRGARRITRGPHAPAARYDHKTGRIVVDLSNGAQFAFPPQFAQGLAWAQDPPSETCRSVTSVESGKFAEGEIAGYCLLAVSEVRTGRQTQCMAPATRLSGSSARLRGQALH